MRSTLPTFTSAVARKRGGIGHVSDDRTANRLEEMGCSIGEVQLPGELRPYSKRLGKGQEWDFFAVVDTCACCGEEHSLNIVSLCGTCASNEVLGPQVKDTVRHHVARHMANFRRGIRLGQ